MNKKKTDVGGLVIVFLGVNLFWGLITGLMMGSFPFYGICSSLIWFIASLFMAAILGKMQTEKEARKRTPSHPVTSYDQFGSNMGAWFLCLVFAVLGFIIGVVLISL